MSNIPLTKKFAASMMAFSLWAPSTWWHQPPSMPYVPPAYACAEGKYCCTPFTAGCDRFRPTPIPTPSPFPKQPHCLFGSYNCCFGAACGPGVVPTPPPIQPILPTPPARPGVYCTLIYSPVCGVDGNTYGNACFAEQIHSVPIAHPGPCQAQDVHPPIVPSYPPTPFPRPTYIEQFNTPRFTTECDPHASVCIPIPAIGGNY